MDNTIRLAVTWTITDPETKLDLKKIVGSPGRKNPKRSPSSSTFTSKVHVGETCAVLGWYSTHAAMCAILRDLFEGVAMYSTGRVYMHGVVGV